MPIPPLRSLLLLCPLVFLSVIQAQVPPRQAHAHVYRPPVAPENPAAVARGRTQFRGTCGFCHGTDATGGRGPDLVRSSLVSDDKKGSLIVPVIRNGRPDKGMPSFPNLTEQQVSDIVTFLHFRQFQALHNGSVPSTYPLSRLLTGNAEAGSKFFYGAGGCSGCHSVTGDLAGVAKKYSPINLQQQMVYPSREAPPKTAVVTLADGKRYQGKVVREDEFRIGLICQDGWYRSWPLANVKVEIHDPLAAHRKLMTTYTDADMHNLFAFLETLK
ncbi:MAG: c-type cytochrome [Bryobacteraceae bacterium]